MASDWLAQAVKCIRTHEGCAKKRTDGMFDAYPDPGKGWALPTIGWGSTGHGIAKGTIWSQSQCDTQLLNDVCGKFGPGVDKLIAGVDTTPSEKAALVSFAYNVGLANLEESTLLRLHRAGKHSFAAEEFRRWVFSNHERLPGLVKRREDERRLYLGEVA